MKIVVIFSASHYRRLLSHLFSGSSEQGAFLFATEYRTKMEAVFRVNDIRSVPNDGWDYQERAYLELKESEKVKVMRIAKARGCSLIECHSHRTPM